MTLPLARLATVYSPRRLIAHPKRVRTSSTQSRLRPTQRGGHNLGSRYQQLESSVRSAAKKVALLEETIYASRSVEQHNPLPVTNESRVPREKIETLHGLVVPQEPIPPESDGELLTPSSTLILILKELVFRMLYVRVCRLRLRSLRGLSLGVQSLACFTSGTAEIHGDPTVGVASTNQVFADFSGCPTTVQHKS